MHKSKPTKFRPTRTHAAKMQTKTTKKKLTPNAEEYMQRYLKALYLVGEAKN